MSPGRWHPSIGLDVQALVTQAHSVTLMERKMGHPPRLIRGPDLCDLFQARDAERLPGLVDRWASYGIMAQVVHIPPGTIDPRPSPSPMILPSTDRP